MTGQQICKRAPIHFTEFSGSAQTLWQFQITIAEDKKLVGS